MCKYTDNNGKDRFHDSQFTSSWDLVVLLLEFFRKSNTIIIYVHMTGWVL